MKKIILSVLSIVTLFLSSHAQCEKKIVFESSKTEFLDRNGEVMRGMDQHTVIHITGKAITIEPSNDHVMNGDIKSDTCAWKVPYKEGKWTLNTIFNEKGQDKKVTIVIEGKENRVSMTVTIDQEDQKIIRVWADKFEEVK